MPITLENYAVKFPRSILENLKRVRKRLESFSTEDFINGDLYLPSVHLLGKKSKLLRSTFVLMGAGMINENPIRFVDLAVAAELLHASSLIHDDIIDGDQIRRGVESVHSKYGIHIGILAGDALIAKSVELASKYGENVLMSITRSSMEMCAGEALDYRYQKMRSAPNLSQYIKIVTLKSASLIASCFNSAAVYKSSKIADEMYLSGKDIGIAFQIRDDIADYMYYVKKGRYKQLVPNVVTSIQKDYGIGRNYALIKAVHMNNEYVTRAQERLASIRLGSSFIKYSDLIRVAI